MRAATAVLISLACLAGLVGAASARPGETTAEREVKLQRLALLKATNDHNLKAVETFFDPGFVSRTKSGQTVDYKRVMMGLEQSFKYVPTLQESIQFEKVIVQGSSAEITSTSKLTFTDPQGKPQSINGHYTQTWRKLKGKWILMKEQEL